MAHCCGTAGSLPHVERLHRHDPALGVRRARRQERLGRLLRLGRLAARATARTGPTTVASPIGHEEQQHEPDRPAPEPRASGARRRGVRIGTVAVGVAGRHPARLGGAAPPARRDATPGVAGGVSSDREAAPEAAELQRPDARAAGGSSRASSTPRGAAMRCSWTSTAMPAEFMNDTPAEVEHDPAQRARAPGAGR